MITGPSSFVFTTQQFITHWTAVNVLLGAPTPLVLPNPDRTELPGITLAMFTTKRTLLMTKRDAVEEADTTRALQRAALDIQKEWLHERMNFFNEAVRGRIPLSIYARKLATVPGVEAGQEAFTKPMKATRSLWSKINAAPPAPLVGDLVLKDTTILSAFSGAITTLDSLWDLTTAAELDLSIDIEARNDVQDELYTWMKAYRLAATAALAEGSALLDTLPRLTPEGGRTPDPVALEGVYNSTLEEAVLDFSASDDPDLKETEIRVTFGPAYDGENDHIVAVIPKAAPRTLSTNKGLLVPGAVATFKAFTRLTSGGEAGSNPITITRPIA